MKKNKKTIISASDSATHKLAVLAKKKEGVRGKLAVKAKILRLKAKRLVVTAKEKESVRSKLATVAKQLATTAKEKEGVRSKLAVVAKQLATTAKEKESVRRKLLVTAKNLDIKAKQLAVTAKEKEIVRRKLLVVAKQLVKTAREKESVRKQLAITAKEKESVRLKLVVTAKEKESVRSKLAVVAKQLAVTAKQKENIMLKLVITAKEKESIRRRLAVTAKKLKGFYRTLEEKITKRTKDLEEAKAKGDEERSKLQVLVDNLSVGVFTVKAPNGEIITVNPRGRELLGRGIDPKARKEGYSQMYATEKEDGTPYPNDELPPNLVLATGHPSEKRDIYIKRPDGSRMALKVSGVPVKDATGKLLFATVVFDDITKEKEIDTAKTEFIFTVSHELRTPLAIIIEGIGLVTDEIIGKINEKQKETLLIAKNNLYGLSSIINSMLDIAKIEAGKMEINKKLVDMGELIKKVVDSLRPKADKKGLQLRIVLPEKGVNIYADSDKITQVLINLINNSIKFTDAGHIEVGVKEFPNEIQCYISDTGIGIANKNLPLAFNKFQQFDRQPGSGEKGTGLGLAICKAIVVSHQGKIWVESEKGKWTKVIFTLPIRSNKKN